MELTYVAGTSTHPSEEVDPVAYRGGYQDDSVILALGCVMQV